MNALHRLDPVYFARRPWKERIQEWLQHQQDDDKENPFLQGNLEAIRRIMKDASTGLRMVVNISAKALLKFLDEGRYRNVYERPVIGNARPTPSKERREVDDLLGFGDEANQYYFGAVALGGTGVRFYGEFCMVIDVNAIPETRLFDRDSYDLLIEPLNQFKDKETLVQTLQGRWRDDAVDMLCMRLLPELRHANELVTTGTVSELVLKDQEFIEVHYKHPIDVHSVEEVRQSPDEVAMEARILARTQAGFPPTATEWLWRRDRQVLARELERRKINYRIVTLHGRGYQWK